MRWLLLVSVLLGACASQAPIAGPQAELEAMMESDQRHRKEIQEAWTKEGPSSPTAAELWKKQQPIDEANVKRLVEIIDQYGWPRMSVFGPVAANAAFIVVQHADLPIQEKYLPALRDAVAANESMPDWLALLEDRVLIRQGKKQRYGSQLQGDGKGGFEFSPIEDEAHVDERRKAVGLEPLAEYGKQFGVVYRPK
jgi:hypothetical protein